MTSTLKFVNTGADYSGVGYGKFQVGPADILGSACVGLFDAENTPQRQLLNANGLPISDGEKVASWICGRQSATLAQTTDAARPTYQSDGFGPGSRPYVDFDGTDDRLTLTGVPASWPTGTADGEIWGIIDSSALDSDSQIRHAFGYGSNASLAARAIGRSQVSSTSRFCVGTGAAAVSGVKHYLNSPMLVCAEFYTETAVQYVGGVENGDDIVRSALAFNTATTIIVMGARVISGAATWSPCKVNCTWVVNRRTTSPERAAFEAFAIARGVAGL